MKKYLLRKRRKTSIKNESDIFVGCTKDSDYAAITINKFDSREEAVSYLRKNAILKDSIVSTNFMYEGYEVEEHFIECAEVDEHGVPFDSGIIIAYSDMPDKTNWLHLN